MAIAAERASRGVAADGASFVQRILVLATLPSPSKPYVAGRATDKHGVLANAPAGGRVGGAQFSLGPEKARRPLVSKHDAPATVRADGTLAAPA